MDLDVADLGRILGIWAHPDDEPYLMGGVMAVAADVGQPVACVTATLGDAGETADAARWPCAQLARIRRGELEEALAVLGVADHECLDLPDGRLAHLDPAGPVGRLVTAIRRVRPDTVITFGPDGMTGHPDHRTVSAWTGLALDRTPGAVRLLRTTKTPEWVEAFRDVNGVVFPDGLPPSVPTERSWGIVLDDATLDRKLKALEAHASQTTGLLRTLGRDRYAEWVRLEAFEEVG